MLKVNTEGYSKIPCIYGATVKKELGELVCEVEGEDIEEIDNEYEEIDHTSPKRWGEQVMEKSDTLK